MYNHFGNIPAHFLRTLIYETGANSQILFSSELNQFKDRLSPEKLDRKKAIEIDRKAVKVLFPKETGKRASKPEPKKEKKRAKVGVLKTDISPKSSANKLKK